MKSLVVLALAALLTPILADGPGCGPVEPPPSTITPPPGTTAPPNPGCPTITSTTSVCSTCKQLLCLAYTSVTNKCSCPAPIPTVYKSVPCGNPADCPASCFTSSFAVQPPCATTVKPPPTTTTTKPTSVLCTTTGTQKVYGTGCAIKCSKEPICIADAAVELPCGCDRVSISVTTQTVCATASPCPVLCSTGWGFFTITPTNCPTARPTATLH